MWNHSSVVAHSTLNRVFVACRDEAIALLTGAINVGRTKQSLRSPRKVVPRGQRGPSQPRARARGVELEGAQTAVLRRDRSEELALEVWSDDGGHACHDITSRASNDGRGSDSPQALDWRRTRGGFRRIALLASRE
jgi:hypothetical protein